MEHSKEELLQRYTGASIALTSMYETISEIQIMTIPKLWEEGSSEIDAVSDALEGVKALIVHRNNQIRAAAEGLLNGNSEE